MTTYARVRISGQSRPILLEVTGDTDRILCGYEVGRDGTRLEPKGFDERFRIIAQPLIADRRPMRMNLHYGELEEEP
jgi:hypothetical protein